jgi:hypothetical protein
MKEIILSEIERSGNSSLLAIIFGVLFLFALSITFKAILYLFRLLLMSINIWAKGYPPPHCGADGDIVENESNEKING